MGLKNISISVFLVFFLIFNEIECCSLPKSWSGTWSNQQYKAESFQDKESYVFNSATVSNTHVSTFLKLIDESHFMNRGKCIANKDERFFFFDKREKCYRCLFIIQRHYNVIQFRETHCDEELTKFEDLCEMLTPDLPLFTMIREDAIAEKCPLVDSYKIFSKKENNILLNDGSFGSYSLNKMKLVHPESNECLKQIKSNIISYCPDKTMIRVDFQDCFDFNSRVNTQLNEFKSKKFEKVNYKNNSDENGLVAQCIAHWNEGSLNYLILKQRKKSQTNRSKNFKCLIFKDLDQPFKNQNNNNILNPRNKFIQMSISEDEFCRDFYSTSDGTNSFLLEKIDKNNLKKDHVLNKCKFPKVLSKKWKNLNKNTNVFKKGPNILQIVQQQKQIKNPSKIHKKISDYKTSQNNHDNILFNLNCIEPLTKHFINNNEIDISILNDYKNYEYDYLVNNINECSSKKFCLWIRFKSDYVMHLKYTNFDPFSQQCLFDESNVLHEDLYFIDTELGVQCPFSNRIYQLLSDKNINYDKMSNLKKRSLLNKPSQFSLVFDNDESKQKSECEHYMKIGCNSKDYTIHKKCKYNMETENVHYKVKRDSSNSAYALPLFKNSIYFDERLPVVESETNRICIAYWKAQNENDYLRVNDNDDESKKEVYFVLSRQLNSDNDSITCSIWEATNNGLKIKDDESLSLCLRNKNILTKSYTTSILNKNGKSNEISIPVASAIISSISKHDEDDFILFDYSGSCSSNKSNQIIYSFFNLFILSFSQFFNRYLILR
ncbi:unnamed protein product [Brachionus calyciflorus]|uniref:Uncharacterized protein n=1 Tax=Brachionus calyciflorus TaxID=104777 RepID=A0A813ZCZ1_9BILA|nr:unnamed protein product [Brachionus calyciflorus]